MGIATQGDPPHGLPKPVPRPFRNLYRANCTQLLFIYVHHFQRGMHARQGNDPLRTRGRVFPRIADEAGNHQPLRWHDDMYRTDRGACATSLPATCGNKLSPVRRGCKEGWGRGATLCRKDKKTPPHLFGRGGVSQSSVGSKSYCAEVLSPSCERL